MNAIFWGVRGSIPSPFPSHRMHQKIVSALELYDKQDKSLQDFLFESEFHVAHTYGGNTACVELQCGEEIFIFDAGSGLRELGFDLLARKIKPKILHIFLSHTHWDHINGFPFFVPAYMPDTKIIFYAPFPIEERLKVQQNSKFFPIPLEGMLSKKKYKQVPLNKDFKINDEIFVQALKLNHPGDSYGYRVQMGNKKFVYATDNELYGTSSEFIKDYKSLIQDADMLVFDAQYTLKETLHKISWGHSSATMGIEMSIDCNVKRLVLFHFDPTYSDESIANNLKVSRDYYKLMCQGFHKSSQKQLEIMAAYEGLEVRL